MSDRFFQEKVENYLRAIACNTSGGTAGGEAVITNGATTPIPAGEDSVVIVMTNALGTLTIEGQVLDAQDESLSLEAPDGKTLPSIAIVSSGGATFTWTAIK